MKITFQCTYRGKPTGYESKTYDENKSLVNGDFEDITLTFANHHIAPTQSLILYLNSKNKLCLFISAIGSLVANSDGYKSPWKYAMDDKIIAFSLVEENPNDRDTIYSLYIDFCHNYIKNSNILLDLIKPNKEDMSNQYSISYDEFYKYFVTDIPCKKCPSIKLPPNSIALIYSPFFSFDNKKKKNLCGKFKAKNIYLEKRRIINSPENYQLAIKNSLLNYTLTTIKTLFKK